MQYSKTNPTTLFWIIQKIVIALKNLENNNHFSLNWNLEVKAKPNPFGSRLDHMIEDLDKSTSKLVLATPNSLWSHFKNPKNPVSWAKSYRAYLPECHKAWFVPYWWHLIAHHMNNRQPTRATISWEYTTSSNNLIHPCTSPCFRWTRVWIKIEVCNRTAWWIIDTIESHILVPNLKKLVSL